MMDSLKVWVAVFFLLSLGSSPMWAFENNPVQGVHQEIQSEMEEEEPQTLPQMQLLWRATLERNPTLQLALQKMAEKTGQLKPQNKSHWTQSMLRNMIQVGGLGGSVMAGSAAPLVGSAMLGRMTAPAQAAKSLTEVTSADLVILAREIEQAQSQLMLTFIQYRHAQQAVEKQQATLDDLNHQVAQSVQFSDQAADILHTVVMDQQWKVQQAQQMVYTYRNLLVLMAGEAAVAEIDKPMTSPQTSQKPQVPSHDTEPRKPSTQG